MKTPETQRVPKQKHRQRDSKQLLSNVRRPVEMQKQLQRDTKKTHRDAKQPQRNSEQPQRDSEQPQTGVKQLQNDVG